MPQANEAETYAALTKNIFDDPIFNSQIADLINSSLATLLTNKTVTQSDTSIGDTWVQLKEEVVTQADKATIALKREIDATARQRDLQIVLLQSALSSGSATESDIAQLASLQSERITLRREARSLYMETEEFAIKQGSSHDTGRAAFYRQWTPKNAAQWVEGVMRADWTDPSHPTNRTTPATSEREVANAFSEYYKQLFAKKTPKPEALERALRALKAGNKVLQPTAARCAASITLPETINTCENLPTGKSPGPERLPNKFYVTFSKIITPILTAVFNEARDASAKNEGGLPTSMLRGIVSILYKKKSPRRPSKL